MQSAYLIEKHYYATVKDYYLILNTLGSTEKFWDTKKYDHYLILLFTGQSYRETTWKAASLLQWFQWEIRRIKTQLYAIKRQIVLNFINWSEMKKKKRERKQRWLQGSDFD